MARLDQRWRDGEGIGYNHEDPYSTRLCCSRIKPGGELWNSIFVQIHLLFHQYRKIIPPPKKKTKQNKTKQTSASRWLVTVSSTFQDLEFDNFFKLRKTLHLIMLITIQ